MLIQKELKQFLRYDKATGHFHWRVYSNNNKAHIGTKAGTKTKSLGYYDDFDDAVCARLAGNNAWIGLIAIQIVLLINMLRRIYSV